ncbi:hypothetical protein SAMD00019534_074320 [Acytostelium subglobosum LB1]|uniref:hypothetical protein n=1 Tax=Acytostelium subglobosum LB1 TaxID=1410327 RepID=UPI000644D55D|nr:hypothetical protein SAMD00019534_074320 [Acytostelium subglobosum LB1]GAM24257.1 hypothetical protein SAMD00019534_074320 [Acytostelium subglobosum LB1]|eukprot:XP_012752583.1 hypothetical protein SAMD00019534_074320 [Acytostelium subglobosum LB1]
MNLYPSKPTTEYYYYPTNSSKTKLYEILNNANLRAAFGSFLKSQFCLENLLCWEAIELYKHKNGNASEIYQMAEDIYNKFIKVNAIYEINIYVKQKELLKEKLIKTFILPSHHKPGDTSSLPKRKIQYWTEVILPAIRHSNSITSTITSTQSLPSTSTTTSSSASPSRPLSTSSQSAFQTGPDYSHQFTSYSNDPLQSQSHHPLSNSTGHNNQIVTTTTTGGSPNGYPSPRFSRKYNSPCQSPFSSPANSPTHSPTEQQQLQGIKPPVIADKAPTSISSSGDKQIYNTQTLPMSQNGGSSVRKSSTFSSIDENDRADIFEDFFTDDFNSADVQFGVLPHKSLFNDIQEELEQMMIENSLGEFLKSKVYVQGLQGNSLP